MCYKEVLNKVLSLPAKKPPKIKPKQNETKEQKQKRLQREKELQNFYGRADFWRDNWNKNYYLKYVMDTGKKHEQIIALFLWKKDVPASNYDEMNFFFNRNLRTAKRLEPFPIERIKKVLDYLLQTVKNYRIALETVEKYMEEDIEELKGEEPIITLSNGEKIYDTTRLKQLEDNGTIYWDGKIWRQKQYN